MRDGDKQNILDALNLLKDLLHAINNEDYERAKTRIKEYGYIADPIFITTKIENIVKENN